MTDYRNFRQLSVATFQRAMEFEQEAHEKYRRILRRTGYWMMMDLKGSAAYRQRHGVENAFKRALVFSRLLRLLTESDDSQATVFKELGDGVLIFGENFGRLLEIVLLMDSTREFWDIEYLKDESQPSLDSRAAVTFGESLVVDDDFLGEPIDLVARLSSHKSDDATVIATLSTEVRTRNEASVEREYPFVTFGENVRGAELVKSGEAAPWICELRVNRTARREFTDYFTGFKELIAGVS